MKIINLVLMIIISVLNLNLSLRTKNFFGDFDFSHFAESLNTSSKYIIWIYTHYYTFFLNFYKNFFLFLKQF